MKDLPNKSCYCACQPRDCSSFIRSGCDDVTAAVLTLDPDGGFPEQLNSHERGMLCHYNCGRGLCN